MRTAAQYLTFSLAIAFLAGVAQGEIPWQTNLRTAHTKAQAEGKLLLLHFYTDQCVWCDRLEEGSFKAVQVNETINQSFVPVKIHAGKSKRLAEMFQVSKFPTDVIVTTDGRTLAHTVSPQDPNRYVAMLTKTLPALGQPPAASTRVASTTPPASMQPPQAAPVAAAPVAAAPTNTMTMPGTGQTEAQLASNRQQAPTFEMPSLDNPTVAGNPTVNSYDSNPSDVITATPKGTFPTPGISSAGTQPSGISVPGMESPNAQPGFETPSFAGPSVDPADVPNLGVQEMTVPEANLPGAGLSGTNLPTDVPADAMELPTGTELPTEIVETAVPATATDNGDFPIEQPELAMEGYCAVTVIDQNKWIEGSPEFGVIHLGKLYLFTSEENMNRFLADPMPYTPVLNEIDVVRFFEERKIVPGKREWGMKDPIYNRMFFFADEEAMTHFYNEYHRYTDAALKVMAKAVNDANPPQ